MGESFCQAKHLRAVVGLHGFVATASLDVNYVLLSLEVLFYLFRRGFLAQIENLNPGKMVWEDGYTQQCRVCIHAESMYSQ